jgi:hypothetical protein
MDFPIMHFVAFNTEKTKQSGILKTFWGVLKGSSRIYKPILRGSKDGKLQFKVVFWTVTTL